MHDYTINNYMFVTRFQSRSEKKRLEPRSVCLHIFLLLILIESFQNEPYFVGRHGLDMAK